MRRNRFPILIAILIFCLNSNISNALEPNDTVLHYLTALKSGDIQVIKDSITGEMYNNSKVFLEQNENYPDYLKKAYHGAKFQITNITIQDNDAVVTVKVNFPNRLNEFVLFLKKDDLGNWKIFRESATP